MNRKSIYYFLFVLIIFSASFISAENQSLDAGSIQLTFDEDTSLSEDIIDDYFTAGETILFSGSADDSYLLGKTVNFFGTTKGSMTAIGETIELGGTIGGNLHGAADYLNITGSLNDTAFIAGDKITISKEAFIEGTVLSASRTLHIMGDLNNGLIAGGGEIIIDSPIKGDVKVRVGKLIITERGSIEGDLDYSSNTELSAKEKERVSGSIEYEISNGHVEKEDFIKYLYIIKGFILIALIISGLLIMLLPGVRAMFKRNMNMENYGKTLLWGLIPLFIFPVLIIITVPLLPLSIALGFSVVPLLGLTQILGLALLGQLLFKAFNWTNNNIFLQFLFSALLFSLLLMLPILNVLVFIVVSAMGAGLIVGKLFKTEF